MARPAVRRDETSTGAVAAIGLWSVGRTGPSARGPSACLGGARAAARRKRRARMLSLLAQQVDEVTDERLLHLLVGVARDRERGRRVHLCHVAAAPVVVARRLLLSAPVVVARRLLWWWWLWLLLLLLLLFTSSSQGFRFSSTMTS